MKKRMRRIAAALIALACVPVTGLTASANVPGYWGSTTWDAADGLEPFDDHGIFHDSQKAPEDIQAYLNTTNPERPAVIIFTRRTNYIRLVLRDNIDPEEGMQQVAAILDAYYPGMQKNQKGYFTDPNESVSLYRPWFDMTDKMLELGVSDLPENADDLEAVILLTLAKRHLISEFYGWGETADFATGYFKNSVLENYPATIYCNDAETGTRVQTVFDWDAVQAYLDTNHPGLTVKFNENSEVYRINGADDMTVREKVELDCELGAEYGICTPSYFLADGSASTAGHNALERPGDVTLDCEIDIMDVIAANKFLLGADTLCDTAKKNSDINGDGTPDETDSLAILKYVVGMTDGFAE